MVTTAASTLGDKAATQGDKDPAACYKPASKDLGDKDPDGATPDRLGRAENLC